MLFEISVFNVVCSIDFAIPVPFSIAQAILTTAPYAAVYADR